jgi:hypothetical protein
MDESERQVEGGEGRKRTRKISRTQKTDIKTYKNFSNMKCHCATKMECPL